MMQSCLACMREHMQPLLLLFLFLFFPGLIMLIKEVRFIQVTQEERKQRDSKRLARHVEVVFL